MDFRRSPASKPRYWHLTKPNSLLFHNAHVGRGTVSTVSFLGEAPGSEDATTVYGAFPAELEKEILWERIRSSGFRDRPSRRKAMFLLDDRELAERINPIWFPDQNRIIVEAQIVAGSRTFRADSVWLNSLAAEWPTMALRYWAGEMSANPIPEIIVQGAVFFPGWRQEPLGMLRPL